MYGTLEDWRAYATERGNAAPSEASDEEALAALTRASDYILYRYVARLAPGYDDTLPVVEPATYTAAAIELENPGFFTRTYTPSEAKVLTQVGNIKWTVVGNPNEVSPVSTIIDAMFFPYLMTGGPNLMLRSIGG